MLAYGFLLLKESFPLESGRRYHCRYELLFDRMSLQGQLEKVIEIAEQVASQLGLLLVDARFGQSGRKRSLEVTIYRQGGRINLEDCEAVSRNLEEALDRQTPPVIDGSYLLEVQSPGIDRQLVSEREFSVFSGQKVEIQSKEKIDTLGVTFSGILSSAASGKVIISSPKAIISPTKSKSKAKSQPAASAPGPPAQIELELAKLIRIKLAPVELVAQEDGEPETD